MAAPEPDTMGEAYEAEHVHAVYEEIAEHFSATRYKPWPIVSTFLASLPPGSIGLDIGCGNGKYLSVNPSVFIVGSDRSTNLAKIAATHQPHASIVADTLALPHPLGAFDFAISIAVIHHLSTPARRVEAVKDILDTLIPARTDPTDTTEKVSAGKALIYVWALEQKGSRRGWDEGHEQDVMVPWVLKGKKDKGQKKREKRGRNTGEVRQGEGGGRNASEPSEDPSKQDQGEHSVSPEQAQSDGTDPTQDRTFQRYYHLYRKGELEEDIVEAGGKVVDSGYEKDNWWAIATPG